MKMNEMMKKARRGATFIEYALLAGLVAIVVAVAAMFFGDEIKGLFKETGKQVTNVTTGVKGAGLSANVSLDGKGGKTGGDGKDRKNDH